MMIVGLTGSIAMGKSTTAGLFAAAGIPVFDSDASVHELYAKGGEAVPAIAKLAPTAIRDGAVDRAALSIALQRDPKLLLALEQAVHPLVKKRQRDFVKTQLAKHRKLVVLDIPLLFEKSRETEVDKIVVVSAPADIQRERALNRPGMTIEKLDFILSKQMPDTEKRAKADYVVDTSSGIDDAKRQVEAIIADLTREV
jgi:dephospho-CoA kinase